MGGRGGDPSVYPTVQRQARWLRPWLASETGESADDLPMFPAVALPGWQVTSTHWRGLLVFNPSTPKLLVEGAPTSSRIDATTSQALVQALQRGHKESVEVGVRT